MKDATTEKIIQFIKNEKVFVDHVIKKNNQRSNKDGDEPDAHSNTVEDVMEVDVVQEEVAMEVVVEEKIRRNMNTTDNTFGKDFQLIGTALHIR